MNDLPQHGPLPCRICYYGPEATVQEANGWKLVRDPGYWGAQDPVVLVLGQSKGNSQLRTLRSGEFDRVAFSGIRDRLGLVLRSIGIEFDVEAPDRHFTTNEKDIAFASLLRCSLSDPSGKTSGSPVMHAMADPIADQWITNCMDRWLSRPNPRLRLVVVLGLTPLYVKRVLERLQRLHKTTFKRINEVAAEACGVTWIFAQHPSRISENHYQRWIAPLPHSKRDAVRAQVLRALSGARP